MTQHKWQLSFPLPPLRAGWWGGNFPSVRLTGISVISTSKPQHTSHQLQGQLGQVLGSLILWRVA